MTKPWHVYIALLSDQRYYVGMTRLKPKSRADRHQKGLGGQFTQRIGVLRILWSEVHPTSDSARRREQQLKHWTHAKKEALICGDLKRLAQLSKRRK